MKYDDMLILTKKPKISTEHYEIALRSIFQEIYNAEKRAEQIFGKLSNRNSSSPYLTDVKESIIEDYGTIEREEKTHAHTCEEVIYSLGAKNLEPKVNSLNYWKQMENENDEIWKKYTDIYPMAFSQRAMLLLFSEGSGMVLMANLHFVIKDSFARRVLEEMISDEEHHLRVGENAVKDALTRNPLIQKKLRRTLQVYLKIAETPVKLHKDSLEQLGLSYYKLLAKMADLNLDRIEQLGVNLGFKLGIARKLTSKLGLFPLALRIYTSIPYV